MTEQETLKIMALIKTAYPRFIEGVDSKTAARLWHEMLKDLDYGQIQIALKRWIATEKWPPSIAEVRSMATGLNNDAIGDWTEGWNQVTRAISKYGHWSEREALDSMDDVTRDCVKAIGWQTICESTSIGVERGHFRTMYEQRKNSIRRSEAIPDSLRTPVERLLLGLEDTQKLLNDVDYDDDTIII